MHCAACGTDNDEGSKFCMTCGTVLEAASAPVDEQPAPEATPAEVAAGDQTPPPPPASADAPAADLTPPPAPAWDPPSGETSVAPAREAPVTPEAPPAPSWDAQPAPPPPPPPPADPPAPPAWQAPPAAAPEAPPAWGAPAAPAPPPAAPSPPAWGAPEAPAAPGWGQVAAPAPAWGQPAAAAPPTGAPAGPPMGYAPPGPAGPPDPHGLGASIGRWGNGAKKQAKTAVAVAGAVLKDGEVVEASVAGRLDGNPAVLALTDQALVLVDDRQWKPTVERFTVGSDLQVQGWQDDRTASLTIVFGGRQLVVDQIGDRPLAVEMAQRIRYRSGG